MAIITETGREFMDAQAAVSFIRRCTDTMLDPSSSHMDSMVATTEMVYAFKALDQHLGNGGKLPISWGTARP